MLNLAPQSELLILADQRNLVDYTRLRELFDAGRIRYVTTFNGTAPENVAGCNFSHYRLLNDFGHYLVWVEPRWMEREK